MPRLDDEPAPLQFQVNALDVAIVTRERAARLRTDARGRSREFGVLLSIYQRVEDSLGRGFDDYLLLDFPGHGRIGFVISNTVHRQPSHYLRKPTVGNRKTTHPGRPAYSPRHCD